MRKIVAYTELPRIFSVVYKLNIWVDNSDVYFY